MKLAVPIEIVTGFTAEWVIRRVLISGGSSSMTSGGGGGGGGVIGPVRVCSRQFPMKWRVEDGSAREMQ